MGAKYTGLTVEVVESEDGQYFDFGVWLDGEFAVFFRRKAGGLRDGIARAKEAAANAAPPEPAPTPTQ